MSGRAPAAAKAAHRAGAGADAPLRLFACGAAGAGKSTLISCLLREHGGTGDAAVHGLAGDVAYRSFASPRRAFAAADTPHVMRDTVAAASTADLALLLVDAQAGLSSETRRHAIVASLLGVRHIVLAVNKLDLVAFDRAAFERIANAFTGFAGSLGFGSVAAIPVCAREGDNVSAPGKRMPWYTAPTLLDYIEAVGAADDPAGKPFRMPVEAVNRGLIGTIASGRISAGDDIAVLPSGQATRIKSIAGASGARDAAQAGDRVTVALADDIAVAPGDMLAALRDRPQIADQFVAHLVWMSAEELFPGRSYLMKINSGTAAATVTELKHQLDVDTLSKLAAKTLGANEVGVCNLSVARPVAFDAYADNRGTGSFVLLDRDTGETVAAGTIDFALRRATNIHLQKQAVSKSERAGLKRHRPVVLWFTGLPSAGKSTVANLVESALHARGVHTIMLDGDNVRHGLNRDLGFTEPDRVENIRRIGEVSKLMTEAGLIVLCSFISPFRAERRMVRELLDSGEFIEVFVDTPLKECIARDPKGLYRRALAGEIKNFTGVDQAYEAPENPELHLSAGGKEPDRLADEVIAALVQRKIL